MKPIIYISAKDGKISFHNADHRVATAQCARGIAHVIVAHDVDLLALQTDSSVDAKAWALFNEGVAESLTA